MYKHIYIYIYIGLCKFGKRPQNITCLWYYIFSIAFFMVSLCQGPIDRELPKNLKQLLDQLDPDPKKLARKLEEKYKIIKKESSVVFNQICINNNLMP